MENTQKLLRASKEVFRDCSFRKGAIIAANPTKAYYPKEAKDYGFVWPRDASYTCIAAGKLQLDIQERFFKWCMQAEGWSRTGLFYEKYHRNGKRARNHFQPDQTGSVLIAVHEHCKGNEERVKRFERLIRRSADGLCRVWEGDHFSSVTQDLWEERLCFPDLEENFSYSLAICSRGLECANALVPDEKWLRVSEEMQKALMKGTEERFCRSFGKFRDERIDASLLGLVWPAGIVPADDPRMERTVKEIERSLVRQHRVWRYENDEYDGWMYKGLHRKKGAGYWPLLSFWMAIYHAERGDKKTALSYYRGVLQDVEGVHIPEQIFDNDLQTSPSPLCWSHAMFVIASEKLGYL